jgi:hypothetical protein
MIVDAIVDGVFAPVCPTAVAGVARYTIVRSRYQPRIRRRDIVDPPARSG